MNRQPITILIPDYLVDVIEYLDEIADNTQFPLFDLILEYVHNNDMDFQSFCLEKQRSLFPALKLVANKPEKA